MLQIKLVCYVLNYTNWSTFVETTAKMKKTKVFWSAVYMCLKNSYHAAINHTGCSPATLRPTSCYCHSILYMQEW